MRAVGSVTCVVNNLFLTSFSGIEKKKVSAAVEITNLDWWVGPFPKVCLSLV